MSRLSNSKIQPAEQISSGSRSQSDSQSLRGSESRGSFKPTIRAPGRTSSRIGVSVAGTTSTTRANSSHRGILSIQQNVAQVSPKQIVTKELINNVDNNNKSRKTTYFERTTFVSRLLDGIYFICPECSLIQCSSIALGLLASALLTCLFLYVAGYWQKSPVYNNNNNNNKTSTQK